jgi:hypothetical protein
LIGTGTMETKMRRLLVTMVATALLAAPALAQPRQVQPLQNVPALWGAPATDFPASFNTVARQIGLDIRAVAGACRSAVQTACDVRLGSLPATLRAQNDGQRTQEIMFGVGGGSAASAADGLSSVTVLLRWAAPGADGGELRAAFSALFPSGGDGVREATLHGTRFQVMSVPGMGTFVTAAPAR